MQNLFARATEWKAPWMERVTPVVRRIVETHPAATIFTRFIPVEKPGDGEGTWKEYYKRWASMTLARLPSDMIDIVPELLCFVPPAQVVDKRTYSPWMSPVLLRTLSERKADSIVISGGETDVCVLATVLGAVDRGFRTVIARDALCSSADEAHDAALRLYERRYSTQVELATVDEILFAWAKESAEPLEAHGDRS